MSWRLEPSARGELRALYMSCSQVRGGGSGHPQPPCRLHPGEPCVCGEAVLEDSTLRPVSSGRAGIRSLLGFMAHGAWLLRPLGGDRRGQRLERAVAVKLGTPRAQGGGGGGAGMRLGQVWGGGLGAARSRYRLPCIFGLEIPHWVQKALIRKDLPLPTMEAPVTILLYKKLFHKWTCE